MNIEKFIGIDNGLCHQSSPITAPSMTGGRGENVYTVKTVYTDITVDGVKDPAYDYGVHLSGITPREREYYVDRETNLEIYMIRGQNGRLYVYGEVTDPDVFYKEDYVKDKVDECDSINIHLDYADLGLYMTKVARVLACEDPSIGYGRKVADTRVVLTEKGFNFELSLDKKGNPFEDGDSVNFCFYYHDINDWKSDGDYTKNLLKLASGLDHLAPNGFYTPEYINPDPKYNDSLIFSAESASGRARIKPASAVASKSGDMLRDIMNGSASVNVISGGSHCAVQTLYAAKTTCSSLLKGGANAYFVNEGTLHVLRETDYEIIFNNAEGGKNPFFGVLGANEYAVQITDKSVILYGAVEKTLNMALNVFSSHLEEVKNGGSTGSLPTLVKGEADGLPASVPMLPGTDHITDVGDDAYMLMNRNASVEELRAYEALLQKAGYERYTDNVIGGTKTATYTGHGNVISLSLTSGEQGCLRVIAEPLLKTALPSLSAPEYEKKTTPQVTMLNPNNLCMIYRLENGEFLILDSGQAGLAKNIYEILSADGNDHPVVAAWFFSHFHQDHNGSFVTLAEDDELLSRITVKSIIYNFPQKLVKDTALYWVDQANLAKWEGLIDKTGAQRYQARTGMRFFFPGAELELLWTYEDIMPFNLFADNTNVTCTGYRLTVAGQTHMLLGDSSEEELREAVKNLGRYVKSDFVQLAHHGHGSNHSPFELYENVNAPVVFIPGVSASGKAEKWAADNAKEVYILKDGTVTLDLPHSVN